MITNPVFNYRVFLLLLYLKRYWDKSLTLNIKSEQNQLSDTQNSVLFAFLSNLSILKFYNKNGSIIFIVGKFPMDIMELILL